MGFSLLEVLVAIAVMAIVAGAAIPFAHGSVDRSRTAAAANYMAGRIAMARFEAVKRSAFVAIRFVENGDGYWLRAYVDGNANGVLSQDIASSIDRPITSEERLDYHFPGVTFGIQPNVAPHRSRPAAGSRRSHSDRGIAAPQLQSKWLVDVRHTVHSWPARKSVRCART